MTGVRYFVTATGTGVGKTYVAASLIRQARAGGRKVAAYKPLISGFDEANMSETDVAILIDALGLERTSAIIERLSPWRYSAPLAPSMAARREGREVDFDKLVAFSREAAQSNSDIVLIEGVGGVMAPINVARTVLDWIERVNMPALLIAGSYLGAISHTLTAYEAMDRRNIRVGAIVVNETLDATVTVHETVEEVRRWTKAVPVIGMARDRDGCELRALLE